MPYRTAPGHDVVRVVRVGTQNISWSGLQGGLAAWLCWAAFFAWLAVMSQAPEHAGAEVYLGGAMVALGIVPALVVTHIVSRRTRQHIEFDAHGVVAQGQLIIDFDQPLDACVLSMSNESALVIRQGCVWMILFGSDLEQSLGGVQRWGPRWHRLSRAHLLHCASELEPGSTWPLFWSVRAAEDATIVGDVEAGASLAALAERVADLAAESSGAWLVLPAAHAQFPEIRIDDTGVLRAFGERIDTHEPFVLDYVWCYGKKNPRADADAILLRQGERALCLSVTRRPGGWPALGALPSAAPELPTPELPADQVLTPVALAALDGYFMARSCGR
jgi:hypothetical protein